MTTYIRLRVVSTSANGKVLFEKYLSQSIENVPYATLIDAMECIFYGMPHRTEFIIDCVEKIK